MAGGSNVAKSARSAKTGKDILERRRLKKEKAASSASRIRKDGRRVASA
jgi:hypothetical protein